MESLYSPLKLQKKKKKKTSSELLVKKAMFTFISWKMESKENTQ